MIIQQLHLQDHLQTTKLLTIIADVWTSGATRASRLTHFQSAILNADALFLKACEVVGI